MHKQLFMKKLRRALRWTFSSEEINDITADYEGFFESGTSEGKTETQISQSLGDPAAIAADLAETMGKESFIISAKLLWQTAWRVVAVTAVGIAAAWAAFWFQIIGMGAIPNILILAVFAVILWFVMNAVRRNKTVNPSPKKHKRYIIICHAVLMVFMAAYLLFMWEVNRGLLVADAENVQLLYVFGTSFTAPETGSLFRAVDTVMYGIPAASVVIALFGFYRNRLYFTIIPHAAIFAFTALRGWMLLQDLSVLEDFGPAIRVITTNYALAVAVMLAALLVIRYIWPAIRGAK